MAIEHVVKTMAKHWLDTGAPSMYGFWTLCGRLLGIPECYCTNLRWAYEEIIGAPKNTLGKKADPPMSDADQMRFCATRGDGAPGVPAAPTHPLDVPSPLSQRALSAAAIVASLAANAAAAAPAGAAPAAHDGGAAPAVSGGGGTAAASASAAAPARKRPADDGIEALEERAAHSNRLCTDKAKEKAAADDAAQKAAEVARKAAVEAEAAAAVADKDRAALERAKEKRDMKARAAKKIADAKAALEQALAEAAALE